MLPIHLQCAPWTGHGLEPGVEVRVSLHKPSGVVLLFLEGIGEASQKLSIFPIVIVTSQTPMVVPAWPSLAISRNHRAKLTFADSAACAQHVVKLGSNVLRVVVVQHLVFEISTRRR